MKLKITVDTENPEDDKELLRLSMNRNFFNFIFDISVNFRHNATIALNLKEEKYEYTDEEVFKVINYVLEDNGLSHNIIEEMS